MTKYILSLVALSLLMVSCGSDDCTQADWVGTYTSTDVCETTVDGVTETTTETTTFEITAGANENKISVDGEVYTIDGCSITFGEGDISFSMELDGNTITGETSFTLEIFGQSIATSCTFTATK